MTVEAMTTNHPTRCADCSHYRGDPSYDCARCPGNASSARPVWCPLEETVSSEVWGGDVTALLSYDARRWLAENAEIVESLASGTWKAAPVSPTEEMRRSGNKVQVGNWYRHIECSEHGTEYVPHCDECNNAPVINTLLGDSSADVFKAMLAAAPANPEDE